MATQTVDLSSLTSGNIKPKSILVFDDTDNLIYIAAKQNARERPDRPNYVTATVDGTTVSVLHDGGKRTYDEVLVEYTAGRDSGKFVGTLATTKTAIGNTGAVNITKRLANPDQFKRKRIESDEEGPASKRAKELEGVALTRHQITKRKREDDTDDEPAGKKTALNPVETQEEMVEDAEPLPPVPDSPVPDSPLPDETMEPEADTGGDPEIIAETAGQADDGTSLDPAVVAPETNDIETGEIAAPGDEWDSGDQARVVAELHKMREQLLALIAANPDAAGIQAINEPVAPIAPEIVQQVADEQQQEAAGIAERNDAEEKRQEETIGTVAAAAEADTNRVREDETAGQIESAATEEAVAEVLVHDPAHMLGGGALDGNTAVSAGGLDTNMDVAGAFAPAIAEANQAQGDTATTTEGQYTPIVDQNEEGDRAMSAEQSGTTGGQGFSGVSDPSSANQQVDAEMGVAAMIQSLVPDTDTAMPGVSPAERAQDKKSAAMARKEERKAALEEARQAQVDRKKMAAEYNIDNQGTGRTDLHMFQASVATDLTKPDALYVEELIDLVMNDEKYADIRLGLESSIPGGTEQNVKIKVEKFISDAAYASQLVVAKTTNVLRSGPVAASEKLEVLAGNVLGRRIAEGTSGKIPIFSPSDMVSTVHDGQQAISAEVGNMTMATQKQILATIKPWWGEFRTTRTNQAVHDMEMMPTNLIKNALGGVQLASKPRHNMSETDEQFMFFMYWMMRTKMQDMAEPTSWATFFTYSAAMGYNELTQAQINWLVTGNKDADISKVDFSKLTLGSDTLKEQIDVSALDYTSPSTISVNSRVIEYTPVASTPPPNKNMSPSVQAPGARREFTNVNGMMVPYALATPTLEEQGRAKLAGIPSALTNIPDPRFSQRGGKMVANVAIVTRRNPDWDPSKANSREFIHRGEDPAGPNDKFINEEVPDIGAGSRDIGAEIDRAEADRLAASTPFKLYAPIHPQACDRYLGEKNYARLGLVAEKYFGSFAEQTFGVNDTQQQYEWNVFVMRVYGPMLYAFVTDMAMQRTSPVFGRVNPLGVQLEFMELNELVDELKRYQLKSTDRSNRVGDSAAAREPIDKHLDDFFASRDMDQMDKIEEADAVIISLPSLAGVSDPIEEPAAVGGAIGSADVLPVDTTSGVQSIGGRTLIGGTAPDSQPPASLGTAAPSVRFGAQGARTMQPGGGTRVTAGDRADIMSNGLDVDMMRSADRGVRNDRRLASVDTSQQGAMYRAFSGRG